MRYLAQPTNIQPALWWAGLFVSFRVSSLPAADSYLYYKSLNTTTTDRTTTFSNGIEETRLISNAQPFFSFPLPSRPARYRRERESQRARRRRRRWFIIILRITAQRISLVVQKMRLEWEVVGCHFKSGSDAKKDERAERVRRITEPYITHRSSAHGLRAARLCNSPTRWRQLFFILFDIYIFPFYFFLLSSSSSSSWRTRPRGRVMLMEWNKLAMRSNHSPIRRQQQQRQHR